MRRLLLLLVLLSSNFIFATHIAGGNITYSCTGNPNEYLITLTLYRDCGGISAPTSPSITFANDCGLTNPTLSLTLEAILPGETAEVSQLCDDELGNSLCNGGTLPGVEQYVYTGLVTFPDVCDSWTMSYNVCDRNTTENLDGVNCFNIVTTLNSATLACNNSPSIVTNYPIPYVCNGQPVSHNFGVNEADGHDLQFSFVNALTTGSTNIAYNAGYSATEPIPGITIDPITGLINFTPTLNGFFVVTVLIEEFDLGGNLLGSIMHDIQFVVQTCSNVSSTPPGTLTNFDNGGTNTSLTNGNTLSMCDGDMFCVDVTFTDADAGDILTLTTNALDVLPGATFTQTGTNPATGTLCWTYTDGYTSSLISIDAVDDACPTPGNSSFLINLDVPPPLNASINDTICGDMVSNLQAFGTPPVTWSVLSGEAINIGTNFSCNPCTQPVASPTVTTTYRVQDGSTCMLADTVTVVVQQNLGGISSTIVTNDTTVCEGECFNINAQAIQEFSGTTAVAFTSTTDFPINSNTTITSTIDVAGLNMTSLSVGSIESVCIDLDHTWDSDLDIFLVCPDGTQFELSTDNGGSGNDYENTCFTLNATVQINSGTAPFNGDYVPEGGVLSAALVGCSANGTWGLQISDDAGGDTGTLFEWSLTLNDEIPNEGPASSVSWSNTDGLTDPSSATSELCATTDGQYILYAYDGNNCWASDTLNVTISTASGNAGNDSIVYLCRDGSVEDLMNFVGGTPDLGGTWLDASNNPINNNILPDTIISGSVYEYRIGAGTGCGSAAFITVNIVDVSATAVVDDSDCQANNGEIEVTPSGALGPVLYSIDGGTLQTSNIFTGLTGGMGTTYTILVEDSIGCQFTFDETVIDDNFPTIDATSVVVTNSNCGADDGVITANGMDGTAPYTFLIEGLSTTFISAPITDLAPDTYNLVLQDDNGCLDTLFNIDVDEINFPEIDPNSVVTTGSNCGINDGTVTADGVNGTAPYTFLVEGLSTTFTTAPITDLAPDTYNLVLQDDNGCLDTLFNFEIPEVNPPSMTYTVVNNNCNTGLEGEITVNGSNTTHYSLNGGPAQTSNLFTGLAAGFYDVTVYSSDPATTNACSYTEMQIEITEPMALEAVNISPDVTICQGDETTLTVEGQGGNGNYVFTWSDGTNVIGTGNSITVSPILTTQYCVTLSEDNCPVDVSCTNVNMPTPIEPSLTADVTSGCYPILVEFSNTSTNQTEIATVTWTIEGTEQQTSGGNSLSYSFDNVGMYDIGLTIESIYGCVYDTVYTQYIETYDYPEANFTTSPNPATIYETEVTMTDLSSNDVVSWNWDMEGGVPSTSAEQNPTTEYPEGVAATYPIVLTVYNEFGCVDSIVGQALIINDVVCYAPNAFTPDGDQFNETWRVYINGIDIYDYHCTIFNRWGEIVFESYNPESEWDGTYGDLGEIMEGTYVWVIYAKDSYNDKKYEFNGTVNILK